MRCQPPFLSSALFMAFIVGSGCQTPGANVKHDKIHVPPVRIFFERGRADIKPESLGVLKEMTALLRTSRDIDRILVTGHCSDDEDCADGLDLERAEEVVDFLIERGIEPSRLEANGLGADESIAALEGSAAEDLEPIRKNNRCVEFEVASIPMERRP